MRYSTLPVILHLLMLSYIHGPMAWNTLLSTLNDPKQTSVDKVKHLTLDTPVTLSARCAQWKRTWLFMVAWFLQIPPFFSSLRTSPLLWQASSVLFSTCYDSSASTPPNGSGRSFRIGGATSASLAGLSDYQIKLIGRWKSDCYRLHTFAT